MIRIEQATIKNVENLAILFDQYRIFYEMSTVLDGAKEFLKGRISTDESIIFFSIDDNNAMTGFTQLYPLFSSTRMKRLWLLNDLFVDPKHRGKGISVALIDRAKQLAKQTGACGLMLETAKANKIGNSLYLRTGFALDEDHNYYSWEN